MTEDNNNAEEDKLTLEIAQRNEQSIIPLLEDVAEWLKIYMTIDINPNNFLDVLDNGILLCKLAKKIQKHSEDYVSGKTKLLSRGIKTKVKSLPKLEFECHAQAKKESFFARENAAQFIKWCGKIGIQDTTLFESEGLVLQKQLKNVVLTLLEIARVACKYEIDPLPSIISLEKEIEDEEQLDEKRNVTIRKKRVKKPLDLDAKVRQYAQQHSVKVEKIKDGKYIVNDKVTVFVRLLRNHIMVRVGGGWDELDHFLSRHNPSKVGKMLVSTTADCRKS